MSTYNCPDCGQTVEFRGLAAVANKTDHPCKNTLQATRPSKYRAQRTEVDGIAFDSKAEARRWEELSRLESAGQIEGLKRQPVFEIWVNGKICTYRGDFAYWQHDRLIIEDVKGVKTPVYKLKKKLMSDVCGLEIVEVAKPKSMRKRAVKQATLPREGEEG